MKKPAITLICVLLSISSLKAQPLKRGTVTDINGNVYQTVVIGNYEWMAVNLKTTVCSDGVKISCVTGNKDWSDLRSGAYCWYNNDESNAGTYGALYNWYAVNTGKLCPDGWHVPSDEEWKFLEGSSDTRYGIGDPIWDNSNGRGLDAGQRLMAVSGWNSGGNGSDALGFSALPGGERTSDGRFFVLGRSGFWWSSTEYDASGAWYRNMIYGVEDINRGSHPKWMGFSVRCIRDKKGD